MEDQTRLYEGPVPESVARLSPEKQTQARAVAWGFDRLHMLPPWPLILSILGEGRNTKYGTLAKAEERLYPDEPTFVLRAADTFAPEVVQAWVAKMRETEGANPLTHENIIRQAEDTVALMEAWQARNLDKVKTPD